MQNNVELETLLTSIPKEQLLELALKGLLTQQQNKLKSRITIDELYKLHLRNSVAREHSPETIIIKEHAHKYLKEYAEQRGLIYADEFSYEHAEEFYTFLKKHRGLRFYKGIKHATIITIYKNIKAAFALAEKREYIVKNRFENKPFPASQVDVWWTDQYVEQLLNAADRFVPRAYQLKFKVRILLTYTTGLRSGVIMHSIKRKNVILTTDQEGVERIYINTKCKVPKSAAIQRVTMEVLDERTKNLFKEYLTLIDDKGVKPDDYIFTKGKPKQCYSGYRKMLVKVCEQAGLEYKKPHGAKHGFITKMAQNGLTAEQICKLTGNLTPSLIQKTYMHLSTGDIRERASKIINK